LEIVVALNRTASQIFPTSDKNETEKRRTK